MKRVILVILCTIFSLFLEAKDVEIVTTLPMIKFIVDRITEDKELSIALVKENTDPHFFDAKLSYIVILKDAKLFILVSSDFEVYVDPLLKSANNPDIVKGGKGYLELASYVEIIEIPASVERTQGELHAMGNPHYFLDPENFKKMAGAIFDKLKEIYPDNTEKYKKNLEKLYEELDTLLFGEKLIASIKSDLLYKRWKLDKLADYIREKNLLNEWEGLTKKFNEIKGEKILPYHKSFTYYILFSKMIEYDVIESKPGIPPSTTRLVELITKVDKEKIKAIIIEPFYPTKTADFIKTKSTIKPCIIVITTNPYNYFEWLKTISTRIYQAVKENKCE